MSSSIQAQLRNLPPATRILAGTFIGISALGLLLSIFSSSSDDSDEQTGLKLLPLLAMVPGSSIYLVWTFMTAGFLETSLLPFLIDGFAFIMMSRYMEHAWGMREFLKFVAIVNVSAYFGAWVMALIEYAGTLEPAYFFETQVCGLGGILCAFVVAYKQMVPEHTITFMQFFSFRVKHLPSVVILGHLIMCLLRLEGHLQFWVALYGSLSAWVYIRFYKVQDGIRGDRSETFSLSSFFPEIIHPIIKPISNSTFNLMVRLKLCPPLVGTASGGYTDLETGKSRVSGNSGNATAEAERRRALALRALDERSKDRSNGIPAIPTPTSLQQTPASQSSGSSSAAAAPAAIMMEEVDDDGGKKEVGAEL
ncbi:hypothetical protein SmJEL517_g02011 [Synchytrium microbalum]|uniref:Peptidase S54 rhomboid domain-containing protein n=1 Tax=Synchytrium microbalum TaxID=1806994 RepID=A0A507CDS4_9FUNG|nr:uncharacterized protein SmJEL517_g02011 [Synchytrium microbalum]TPX35693.1 hypothetical protein SmJEL517_g02011 [Synchytrium microbalum]